MREFGAIGETSLVGCVYEQAGESEDREKENGSADQHGGRKLVEAGALPRTVRRVRTIGVDGGEVLELARGVGLQGLATLCPVGGADLAVLLLEAQSDDGRRNEAQSVRTTNWKALMRRMVSSTERPTGRSLTVIWRRTPWGSMMKRPRRATPSSSMRTL